MIKEFKFQETTVYIDIDEDEYNNNKIYRENIKANAQDIADDPDDYGPCHECKTGRIRYWGGSQYYCPNCDHEEIKPVADLVKFGCESYHFT